MGLSENLAQHCRNVANLMRAWAPLLNLDAEETWLLGWLHDIGYTLGDNEHHAHLGGELLRRLGYAHYVVGRLIKTPEYEILQSTTEL